MKIKNISFLTLLITSLTCLLSCSTDFIEEQEDYSSVNDGIYKEEFLATGFLSGIYKSMLPDDQANMAAWSRAALEHSRADLFARSTDQLSGETDINIPWTDISPVNNHALKSIGKRLQASASNTAYTRIRYCNLYLGNVDNFSGLNEDFKNQMKGQLYFWRAWQYFELLKLYGGVPLILEAQSPNVDDTNNQTPRSTSAEVIDQIVADLDMSYTNLSNARPYTADESGKITAAAAVALKGRVLLTWASPQFNRTDDQSRWQRAYTANKEAYEYCLQAGKGLDPDWRTMWFRDNGMESIFAFGFNNFVEGVDGGGKKSNYTEYQSRSRDQGGAGGISPTKNTVDAFPMADGTPYNPDSNLNDFYKNRDPRFYHTFAYNGSIWPFSEDANYRNWTYFWFPLNPDPSGPKIATNTTQNGTGIYLKKFTNPNSSNEYDYQNNGDDYMEIRFAEIVLNLAESAIGVNNLAEGKSLIQDIRARAGISNEDGQYGLTNVNSRDQHFEAVINERKVEFAYENKRFHDLRRWLLYNDNFGTCTRLNQEPIEGIRRKGYFTFAKSDPSTYYVGIPDPFKGEQATIINRDATTYPEGVSNYEEYVDYLYDNHFEVVVRDDVDVATFNFTWYDEYYFFGLYREVMDTAPYLEQTIGWGGSFNPLE